MQGRTQLLGSPKYGAVYPWSLDWVLGFHRLEREDLGSAPAPGLGAPEFQESLMEKCEFLIPSTQGLGCSRIQQLRHPQKCLQMPWRHDGNMHWRKAVTWPPVSEWEATICADWMMIDCFHLLPCWKLGIFWLFPDTRVTWPNWQRCFSVYWGVNVCVCQNGYWN